MRRAGSRYSQVLKLLAAGAVLAVCSAALVIVGLSALLSMQRIGSQTYATRVALRAAPSHLFASLRNHAVAIWRNQSFERVHLDIKFKNFEKLRAKRQEAMAVGVLISSDEDFVPASIRFQGESLSVSVRLKGDSLDHLSGDKWSLRVKVKKDGRFLGMRRFSLQAPRVRDFHAEVVFLSHLRREGVLVPRYHFVDLSLNGKDLGVMAVEEHFSKELLESQQRREGVIVRFDESTFWNNLARNGTFGPYSNPHIATLTPFDSGKVAANQGLSSDHAAAVGLMRGFLAGKLAVSDVFDAELMARFMAVAEVWRAYHPMTWHNLRFYYNPLTARLEPIAFDGGLHLPARDPGLVAAKDAFTLILLEDEAFRSLFVRTLARIAKEMADGSIAAWARPMEAQLAPRLQEGLQHIEPLHLKALETRAALMASIDDASFDLFRAPLGRPDMKFPELLNAYLCGNCSPPRLELINTLPIPVVVESLKLTARKDAPADLMPPVPRSEFPLEIPATEYTKAPAIARVEFEPALDPGHFDLDLVVRVAGQTERHALRAQRYFDVVGVSPFPTATLDEALTRHPFLRVAENRESLVAAPGTWDVKGSLVIPPGLGLTLVAGTELRFAEDGILVASGPLRFTGEPDRPVRLAPRHGSATWGGIMSPRSAAPHEWRHVVIESTSGIERSGWRMTGGVTLLAAEVAISNSKFVGNRAEDALNVIRSRFELDGVDFENTASDAIDADFSDGVIRGGRFSKIGGDGIDVSGAVIEVDGTVLSDIADKAISVGERSRLTARNVRIERVGTGAASKDASELEFEDSSVVDASVAGVSAYTKKPEYGPAAATLARVRMERVAIEALVQTGSRVTVDGSPAETRPLDVENLYQQAK